MFMYIVVELDKDNWEYLHIVCACDSRQRARDSIRRLYAKYKMAYERATYDEKYWGTFLSRPTWRIYEVPFNY
jgi:hypothetical protein